MQVWELLQTEEPRAQHPLYPPSRLEPQLGVRREADEKGEQETKVQALVDVYTEEPRAQEHVRAPRQLGPR